MAINKEVVTQAGDIDLQELVIVKSSGTEISIREGYIGELNLFEDIFRGGLYGNILIVDALNLSQAIELTGDEYLRIKMTTPSADANTFAINKTFKIYSITDRIMTGDTGKQTFIMHFCSPEVFIDALSPIYRTFKYNKISSLAAEVFKYISTSRTGEAAVSNLNIIGETQNSMQFTSPGWRPIKIMNWLASKAVGAGYKSPAYLFYESNKAFYFANMEALIDTAVKSRTIYQEYWYMANNLVSAPGAERFNTDLDMQYRKAQDLRVIETYNALKNTTNGYLANRLYTFDVVNKIRKVHDYNHIDNWGAFHHLEDLDGQAVPMVPIGPGTDGSGALRAPQGFNQVYMQHDQLYTGVKNNAVDGIEKILPIRTSALAELTNFKIELTVPGRTDIEVGYVVNLHYPDASPRSVTDKSSWKDDELYSGYYLVTAIRHKITYTRHVMVLELIKDSFKGKR